MYKRIVVPLDGTPGAEGAIEVAISTATASAACIDLVLVHNPVAVSATEVAPWNADRWATERGYLGRVARATSIRTSSPVSHIMLRGDPATMICKRAIDERADLIIMESRTRTGVARALLGSVADKVLRHTAVPVLLLRSNEGEQPRATAYETFERILLAHDGSLESAEIIHAVSELAHAHKAEIVLLRIVQPVPLPFIDVGPAVPYSPSMVDLDATEMCREQALVQNGHVRTHLERLGNTRIVSKVLTEPSVGEALSEFANRNRISVIAMSVHGRGASRIVVGSIADNLLRRTTAPLLLRNCRAEFEDNFCMTEEEIIEQLPSLSNL